MAQTLVKKGFTVNIEEDAGRGAKFTNQEYESAGAKLVNKVTAFESGLFQNTLGDVVQRYDGDFFLL